MLGLWVVDVEGLAAGVGRGGLVCFIGAVGEMMGDAAAVIFVIGLLPP